MIHIEKVTNRKGLLKFIQFRYDLYKDDPNDVPYLFFDEVNTLDKRKNSGRTHRSSNAKQTISLLIKTAKRWGVWLQSSTSMPTNDGKRRW